jgi:CubicO group peptidase (beta-lactamase class C family)
MIASPLRFRIVVCLAILTFAHQAVSIQLPSSPPAAVGMSADRLARIDQVIAASIAKKELPGAVVLVARHGRVAWRKAYGARAVEPQREPMPLPAS